MRKLTGIIFCIAMGISLLAHAADYELTARVDIEASDGKLKSIVTSSLAHAQGPDKDTFTLIAKDMQIWVEPRTAETEEKARQAGTPIDGTVFSPKPEKVMTFAFDMNEKTNALVSIENNRSERATEDLINLLFFKGERMPIRTENLAVMLPEYANEYNVKVSEYDITLYVYWYDSLIRRKDKEAPTYLLFVKDKENKMLASRMAYQAVKTTSMEVAVFNLCSSGHDIDLDEIVRELNDKLGESFMLKTVE